MTYEEAVALITRIGAQSIMTPPEREFLFYAARASSHRVVEVGSAYGGTTILLALAAGEVTSIDNRGDPNTHAEFKRNLSAAGLHPDGWAIEDRVHCIDMDSLEAALQIEDESCGLVIVDGNHYGDYPYNDLRTYAPKVCPGGILAIDDTSCGFPDVTKATWRFLCEQGESWEFIDAFEHPEFREPIIQIKLAAFRRVLARR